MTTYCLQRDTVEQNSHDQKLTESHAIASLISFAFFFQFWFPPYTKEQQGE